MNFEYLDSAKVIVVLSFLLSPLFHLCFFLNSELTNYLTNLREIKKKTKIINELIM